MSLPPPDRCARLNLEILEDRNAAGALPLSILDHLPDGVGADLAQEARPAIMSRTESAPLATGLPSWLDDFKPSPGLEAVRLPLFSGARDRSSVPGRSGN